ncbi:MAG: ABC transporter substrate-binding protein [Treponema sp.]|jgi:putative aldouronate transport system substrate-binding protein|nr:ABC transporter substrate-binding protein [Treponema sp.]
MRRLTKKAVFLIVAGIVLAGTLYGRGRTESSAGGRPAGAPDTWIADRKIVIQVYIDDIGYTLPDNQSASPAFQEIKRRTGIDLQVNYTPGQNDMAVMASQLAAGTIPDMIVAYLNNSTRPEFPVLLKAAKDGMFADLSTYFAGAKVYNRYLEPGFLPNDTRRNVMWRDDLAGKVYLVHLQVPAVDRSLEFDATRNYVGGPYIQERIAQALNIDVRNIRTSDDFYNLLTAIKNGNFRDNNGRPVTPLGPKYWGGSFDALALCMPGLTWGVSDNYNITPEGKVLHEAETEWAMRRVNYARKLLAEGLMDQEFFTMDTSRTLEYYTNNSGAIMGDTHNYVDLINQNGGWIPLNYLNDWQGDNRKISGGKTGYCVWAVSADARNPQEIFSFVDWLSTYEGQVLGQYGIEGLTYNMVNGMPRINTEVQGYLSAGERTTLVNRYGFGFGGAGNDLFNVLVTNTDNITNFGEERPGMSSSTQYSRAIEIGTKYPPASIRLLEGLSAGAYLSDEGMTAIKARLDLLNYNEAIQQAIYATSDAEAARIIENFRQQLVNAGVRDFEAHLERIYKADPKAINFRP